MNDLRLPMTFEEAKQILEKEVDWDWEPVPGEKLPTLTIIR